MEQQAYKSRARMYRSIVTICLALGFSNISLGRSVFLNGQDISSARQQNVRGANINIDEEGNVFIEAPHYRVQEEKNYVPLSTWVKDSNVPSHKDPGAFPNKKPTSKMSGDLKAANAGEDNNLPSPSKPESALNTPFQQLTPDPSPAMNSKDAPKNPPQK